eukprot:1625357-Pleurochrysis_carterae.AAC.3
MALEAGGRQSGHFWQQANTESLKGYGFSQFWGGPCIYITYKRDNSFLLVIVWIDELAIAYASKDEKLFDHFAKALQKQNLQSSRQVHRHQDVHYNGDMLVSGLTRSVQDVNWKCGTTIGGEGHVAGSVVQHVVFGGVRVEDVCRAHAVSLAFVAFAGGLATFGTLVMQVRATAMAALDKVFGRFRLSIAGES